MKKISFVLPCYNVERYIKDCLDSLYSQDLSEEDYEVICVNDCSTDRTSTIIANYALRHPNFIQIEHVKNMSVGGARNTGLYAATGEYVWFVDPDDLVIQNCLNELYETAKNNDAEVLLFNYCVVNEKLVEMPQYTRRGKLFVDSPIMSGQGFVLTYTPNRFSEHCIVWRCLFKNSFLKSKDLGFPHMCKAEDVSFLWKALLYADRVGSIGETCYIYRSNPYSVSKKEFEARVAFSDRVLRASRIVDMLGDKDIHIADSLVKDMLESLEWCVNSTVDVLRKMTIDERINYYFEIVNHKKDVKKVVLYMNRKNRLVFSTFMGKYIWIKKVQLICFWENRKKCR